MMEILQNALVDVYRLEYRELAALLAAATACFLLLRQKWEGTGGWKLFLAGALLLWTAMAVFTTLGSRGETIGAPCQLIPFHSYREVRSGGNPELYRSNLMNAVLFYPGGLLLAALLPEKRPRWAGVLLTAVVLAALSAGIECAQYVWHLGRVEMDDVLHNGAGALAGALAQLLRPERMGQKRA